MAEPNNSNKLTIPKPYMNMNNEQKTALENHLSKMKDIILDYAIENANMRDRLEELGELEALIEDGSVQEQNVEP